MLFLAKNRCFVVTGFKNLKMEFKFKYTNLMSVKVKENLRKSHAQFREKLRLRQNYGFLLKKNVYSAVYLLSVGFHVHPFKSTWDHSLSILTLSLPLLRPPSPCRDAPYYSSLYILSNSATNQGTFPPP